MGNPIYNLKAGSTLSRKPCQSNPLFPFGKSTYDFPKLKEQKRTRTARSSATPSQQREQDPNLQFSRPREHGVRENLIFADTAPTEKAERPGLDARLVELREADVSTRVAARSFRPLRAVPRYAHR